MKELNITHSLVRRIATILIVLIFGLNGKKALSQCNVSVGMDTVLCQTNVIPLVATPGQPGNYLYEWTPNTGVADPFAQSTSAVLNYNEPYVYTVTLTDTANNCTAVDSFSVIALNEINDTLLLCGDSVYLEMPPGGTSYSWTGGGQTSQGIWVTQLGTYHGMSTHPACGTLSHVLNVTSCFNSCSAIINYSNVGTSNCNGDSIAFTATSQTGVASWLWNFGDGQTSTSANPTHVYSQDGIYTVTLTAIDSNNCTSNNSITNIFHGPLSVNINQLGNGCQNCVNLHPNISYLGLATYKWTDASGNVLSTGLNFNNICHADNDTFIFTITNAYGCSASDTAIVNAYNNVVETYELCGSSVTLDLGPGASSYQWQTFMDVDSNVTNLSATTQTFSATQVGTYTAVADFPGCGQITSVIEVDSCPPCSNDFTYQAATGMCGDTVTFAGTAQGGTVVSWSWDFGDGGTSSQQNPVHIFTRGTYTVELTTVNNNGCTSIISQQVSIGGGFHLTTSNDITSCQPNGANLWVTPSVASNFTYQWSPGMGLNDSTSYHPTATSVHNQTYVVTVTDTASGCFEVDSVTVSAYSAVNDTFGICGLDSVELDFGPGADNYYWQTFVDLNGDTTQLSDTTQTLTATEAGWYFGYAVYPTCGALTSQFTVLSCTDSVWPGDANNDLIANNNDLLTLGVAYGGSGLARPNASINWEGQPSYDWSDTLPNGVNYKYVDCNGDGVLNMDDTLAINQNYGLTHSKGDESMQANGAGPLLVFSISQDTVGVSSLVNATIHLGTADQQAIDVYGVSFLVNFNPALVDTNSITVSYGNSWLGVQNQNMIGIRYISPPNGRVDFGTTRINHQNISGFGPIATMRFITIDNLSGKTESLYETLGFTISKVILIDKDGNLLPIDWQNDEVVIAEKTTGIVETVELDDILVYPNPATNEVFVKSSQVINDIRLLDGVGRLIETTATINSTNSRLDISGLSGGVYVIEVTTESHITRRTLMVMDK